MTGFKDIFSLLKAQYDKLIALAVLTCLVISLVYLAVRVGMIRIMQDQFQKEIDDLKPAHEHAVAVETQPFVQAVSNICSPIRLPEWTNSLLVPEMRVWCVDCKRPIPFDAMACPFCKAKQPLFDRDNWERDTDGDGIPDKWEDKYGLDPRNPDDAKKDNDKDGFSNIAEFMAEPRTDLSDPSVEPGTDMNDPNDYPPIEALLRLVEIVADPFELRFKSIIKLPGKSVIELPDKSVIELPDKSVIELPGKSVIKLPEKSVLNLPGKMGIELPEASVLQVLRGLRFLLNKKTGEKVADFELHGDSMVELPAQSLLKSPDENVTELPEGSVLKVLYRLKFGLNFKKNERTYFKKLGEKVLGFMLFKYEPKFKVRERGGIRIRDDVSELTLKRGARLITLVKGQDVMYSEYIAQLLFELDGSEYKVKIGDSFKLKGKNYKLIDIDRRQASIVILRLDDGKQLGIRKFPEREVKEHT